MKNRSVLDRVVSNWPAKALSLAAAIILFLFHNYTTLSERFITVPLIVRFADGYTAGQQYPRKVRVVVRGHEKSLAGILEEDIEARVDFSRRRAEGTYKAPIVVRKKTSLEGMDPLELRVEPLEITVKIERKVRKSVEVVPGLRGFPAAGYGMEQYTVTPSRVEVEGPKSRLENIVSVPTEEIDLSGKRDNFNVKVRLVREDSLVAFPGGDTVEFKGFIGEAVGLKLYDSIPVEVTALDSGLRPAGDLPEGSVRVQGGQLFLDNLRNDRIRLTVDCTGIKLPGTYTLPVKPDVPAGLIVMKYEPASVTLDLGYAGAER